ncbi:MAG: tRNA preQ1(34) S-adenosylmethionine ribosyltransferase-isomerase QueA [Pseudomonadota bacterium]
MRLTDFDYELPDELIARYPTAERRGSRLLVVGESFADRQFTDLPDLLAPGDLLVFNDTRVIPARLAAVKATGGRVEILLERVESPTRALAMLRSSKTPKAGSVLTLGNGAQATVTGRQADFFDLEFSVPVSELLDQAGEIPLPPYLGRDAESADSERYQTVYARNPGAVAAPTAGLHFDEAMLEETRARGVRHAWVTLHVGAGTFQSLRHERVEDNRLHSERVIVDSACVDAVRETRAGGGRVIAIGTTAVRSLEAASAAAADRQIALLDGETELFIKPGYRYRAVDAMLTNFHLPQSSLLMLVAAFAGREHMLAAYRHAVGARYRFFSYGDAMLLTRAAAQ